MKIKLDPAAFMPERAHPTDAGADLRSPVDFEVAPYSMAIVDTGVHIELPKGTVGFIKSKSGLMARGITVDGTIDEPYRGSIRVVMWNHRNERAHFKRGDKVAHIVVQPVMYEGFELADELDETDRGANGFGSTGR